MRRPSTSGARTILAGCGAAALIALGGCASEQIDDETAAVAVSQAAWAPGVSYAVGDEVSYQGRVYRAIQGHTAQVGWQPPAVPSLWVSTAVDGAPWAPQTAYAVGQRVTHGGQTYAARQGHTSQPGWEPPAVPALWELAGPVDPPDDDFTVWPNPASRASSDPWLVAHHDQIERVEPNLLVLLYANPHSAEDEVALVRRVADGISEGSRARGFADPTAPRQIEYQITVRDLRDGVDGRPPPPDGYPFENSTLYPRRPGEPPGGSLDYARFFAADYAQHLGYPDPARPGEFLDLCTLVEQGTVHEVWFVGSGDVPDANAAEVLGMMPRYDASGTPIPGEVNRCSGNGCFEADVPYCGRSLRIGFVNYTRGPGCYLHSHGHGLEFGVKDSIPALAEWFVPYTGFDYDTRYGLPFPHLYALGCDSPPCFELTSPTHASFVYGNTPYEVNPFDPVCGNVHFPPNGVVHYDYGNPQSVATSCLGFGRHEGPGGGDAVSLVNPSHWSQFGQFDDCGGEFLVWWYQNMPGHRSGQTFTDGRPMPSLWPFLYY